MFLCTPLCAGNPRASNASANSLKGLCSPLEGLHFPLNRFRWIEGPAEQRPLKLSNKKPSPGPHNNELLPPILDALQAWPHGYVFPLADRRGSSSVPIKYQNISKACKKQSISGPFHPYTDRLDQHGSVLPTRIDDAQTHAYTGFN